MGSNEFMGSNSITNLAQQYHYRRTYVIWLWGGYSVANQHQIDFFHYILFFLYIISLVGVHILLLHY